MGDTYKTWLDTEYDQWIDALNSSTVNNFKEHPMVKRMLSLEMEFPSDSLSGLRPQEVSQILSIDNIGYITPERSISGACARMVHYARKVLERKPSSVVEIGGGVGQFYAIMRALGYKGYYWIADLLEVQDFQLKYLQEVENVTGLHTQQEIPKMFDMVVSFYALGEFDDGLKKWYIDNIVSRCPRGFILWNPHSGASAKVDFPFPVTVTEEDFSLHPDNKQIEW